MNIALTTPNAQNLDLVFAALADPTRRQILARLAQGDASVKDLSAPFEISQPAISKHLKVLEHAGLIERRVDQQKRPASLTAQPMRSAYDWLDTFRAFWGASFDRLDAVLDEMQGEAHDDR